MEKPVYHEPEAVAKLRRQLVEKGFHMQDHEPDWGNLLRPLEFPYARNQEDVRREMANYLRRIWTLRFADHDHLKDLIIFNYTELPAICGFYHSLNDQRRLRLCALFRFLIKIATQGNSVFPGNPTEYAMLARNTLTAKDERRPAPSVDSILDFLAGLFVDERVEFRGGELKYKPKSGTNFAEATDPNRIALWEHQSAAGEFDEAVCKSFKFTTQKRKVAASREFRADWENIKRHFPIPRILHKGRILRSEYQTVESKPRPDLVDAGVWNKFLPVFDSFCWKWFLQGMEGDEPLVERVSYKLTPYGTQVFMPGYWSVDFARDIHWKELASLHRARGVTRQGKKLAGNRKAHETDLKKVFREEKKARAQGLRGEELCERIKRVLKRAADTDHSQIRALIREAKRRFGKTS